MFKKSIFFAFIVILVVSTALSMQSKNDSTAEIAQLMTDTFYDTIKAADTLLEANSNEANRLLLQFQKIWVSYFIDYSKNEDISDEVMNSPETFKSYLVTKLIKMSPQKLQGIKNAVIRNKAAIQSTY